MVKQTLEFFSGFPVILSPNDPAKLKRAKLDGREHDIYQDRIGRHVEVFGLNRDYHLYVLASRPSAIFGDQITWDKNTRTAETTIIFQTYPTPTVVEVTIFMDGSSPYPLPRDLRLQDIYSVTIESPESGGAPLGVGFTHTDGSKVCYMLSPDLLHYIRFQSGPQELADFKVEYIGIACGPNGDRNAFQRAEAHEKIVEIQGDFQQRFGNRSLFLFAYDPGYFIKSTGFGANLTTGPDLVEKLLHGGRNSLFEAMEASLISHFKPRYNREFRDFPKHRPVWLSGTQWALDGFVLDVGRILVTFFSDSSFSSDGKWYFGGFFSDEIKASNLHFIDIDVASSR